MRGCFHDQQRSKHASRRAAGFSPLQVNPALAGLQPKLSRLLTRLLHAQSFNILDSRASTLLMPWFALCGHGMCAVSRVGFIAAMCIHFHKPLPVLIDVESPGCKDQAEFEVVSLACGIEHRRPEL